MPNQNRRPLSTQRHRATETAQFAARRLRDDPITPHPPTVQIRVYAEDGRTATLHPVADILSPRTRRTLAALMNEARRG